MKRTGIVGIVCTNGNGIYPPGDDVMIGIMRNDAKPIEVGEGFFPVDICIIGHHQSEDKVCRHTLTVRNLAQWRYLKSETPRYGNLIPLQMLNQKGLALPEVAILNSNKIAAYDELVEKSK